MEIITISRRATTARFVCKEEEDINNKQAEHFIVMASFYCFLCDRVQCEHTQEIINKLTIKTE